LIGLAVGGGILVVAGALSPQALRVFLRDLAYLAGIILACAGLGAILRPVFRLKSLQVRWAILSGLALGVGGTSMLVLLLGAAGVLHRSFWIVWLGAFATLGAGDLLTSIRRLRTRAANADCAGPWAWNWLVVIGFGGLAVVAATLPPGLLWPEEGNGYDALEYHLAAPREYLERGRITFLPHNIYSNFPFNIEMLYLLAMVLRGDAVKAVFIAQSLNLALAVLAVAAVWLIGRESGARCGMFAGVMAATCPFFVYLSGVAYVENGLLFFTAMALAAVVRAGAPDERNPLSFFALAGAMSGFACGCKYIALPMVLVPIAILTVTSAFRLRNGAVGRPAACFFIASGLTVVPWLVKNYTATGNPVFPLARSAFGERAGLWNEECAARWAEGHLPDLPDRSITGRLSRLWSQVIAGKRFGPVIGIALLSMGSIWGAQAASPRITRACWVVLLCGLMFWLTSTHLVDRFAVTIIPPASVIAARLLERISTTSPRRAALVASLVIALAGAINLSTLIDLFSDARVFEVNKLRNSDGTEWFVHGDIPTHQHVPTVNRLTSEGAKVLVVADARRFYLNRGADYCVVFNQNPFADAASRHSPAALLSWLRRHGYTYVLVNWGEMRRLRKSRYGFWESIDEELFRALSEAGLAWIEDFAVHGDRAPYATLFRAPDADQRHQQ
jgi:hypothetical protein